MSELAEAVVPEREDMKSKYEARIEALADMVAQKIAKIDEQEREIMKLTAILTGGGQAKYLNRVDELETLLTQCFSVLVDGCAYGCRAIELREKLRDALTKVDEAHPLRLPGKPDTGQ